MAFTTIPGSGASDAVTYAGTSGVDSIALANVDSNVFLGANEAADTVVVTNFKNLATNYTLKGGQGTDTLTFSANNFSLNSSFVNANANNDTVNFLNSTSTTILGGQGNDNLTNAAGGLLNGSRINGNKGTDTVAVISAVTSSIFGGQGNDILSTGGVVSNSVVSGDLDADQITIGAFGTTGSVVNGNGGNDNVTIGATSSTGTSYRGGGGNDTLTSATATASTSIFGDVGNDNITGSAFIDTVDGGVGNDTINAGALADALAGGGGSDQFAQAAGSTNAFGNSAAAAADLTDGDVFTIAADVISDFGTDDTIATGTNAGTRVAAGADSVIAANQNTTIRGTYDATAGTFTTALAAGADTLVITSNAADYRIEASLGTNATVLTGVTAVAAAQFV